MLGNRGRRGAAAVVALGFIAGTAPPASAAVTWTFEDGVLAAEGVNHSVSCSAGALAITDGADFVQTGVPCDQIEKLELTLTVGGTVGLGYLSESEFPAGFFAEVTGSNGHDLLHSVSSSEPVPMTGDLGLGNDQLTARHGAVQSDLGPGADTYDGTFLAVRDTFQEVDCGTGTDTANVEMAQTNQLVAYPAPDDARLVLSLDDSTSALSVAVDCENYTVLQSVSSPQGSWADLVPSVDQAIRFWAAGAWQPDTVYVDIRDNDWNVIDNGSNGTIEPLELAPVNVQLIYGNALDESFVYNGRDYSFVDAVYFLFLGRFADSGGFGYWTQALFDGGSRTHFVAAMQRLPEHAGLSVDLLYDLILDRAPDGPGRSYWAGRVQAGDTLDRLRALLYGSPEYYARAGSTNPDYIDAVYNDVLERPIDPAGRQYWLGRLTAGESRSAVAAAMLGLDEPVDVAVRRTYQRLLGRVPSAGEATFLRNRWRQTGEFTVAADIAGSDEFYTRVAPLDPAQEPAYIPGAPTTATATGDTPTDHPARRDPAGHVQPAGG